MFYSKAIKICCNIIFSINNNSMSSNISIFIKICYIYFIFCLRYIISWINTIKSVFILVTFWYLKISQRMRWHQNSCHTFIVPHLSQALLTQSLALITLRSHPWLNSGAPQLVALTPLPAKIFLNKANNRRNSPFFSLPHFQLFD